MDINHLYALCRSFNIKPYPYGNNNRSKHMLGAFDILYTYINNYVTLSIDILISMFLLASIIN